MTYGIICAMQEEFGHLENLIENTETKTVYGRDFISGKINGNDVIAVVSRIGKVAAAITTALLIDKFSVDAILFCGIAGGLKDDIKVGDIAIGTSCVQHDFYLADNDIFRIPLLNVSSILCDSELSKRCISAAESFSKKAREKKEICEFYDSMGISTPSVHTGVIASGDQFINKPEKKAWLKEKIEDAVCCEMEGAAVAQACFEAGVPFAIIRVISDSADDNADFSFDQFVGASSLFSQGIIKEFFA